MLAHLHDLTAFLVPNEAKKRESQVHSQTREISRPPVAVASVENPLPHSRLKNVPGSLLHHCFSLEQLISQAQYHLQVKTL